MSDSRLKESNIEWLGEIPKDWNLMPIKYGIKNSVSGDWGTDPLKKSNQKKCICLRVADFDFDKGIFKQNKYTIRAYSQEKINQLKLQSGDILIEKSGGGEKQPVGRAVLFDKDFSAMFANFLVRIRTNKLLVPSFLEYYLRALYYTGSTRLYFNQTTGIQNLKVGTLLSNEKIPNISIALQNNITNYLNKRCKKVDDIIAKVQQEITDLEEYRRSLIIQAVTKGLDKNINVKHTEIPYLNNINRNWFITKIGYICTKLQRPIITNAMPLVCSNHGHVIPRPKTMVGKMVSEDNAMQGIKKGDIAIHGMDTWHGAIALSHLNGKITRVVHVCESSQDNRFIVYYLQALAYLGVYKLISYGVRGNTSDFRSWEKVKNIYIPIPTKKEQLIICNYLDKKSDNIESIIQKKQKLLNYLDKYKQSIIYEYVTGKKQVSSKESAKA